MYLFNLRRRILKMPVYSLVYWLTHIFVYILRPSWMKEEIIAAIFIRKVYKVFSSELLIVDVWSSCEALIQKAYVIIIKGCREFNNSNAIRQQNRIWTKVHKPVWKCGDLLPIWALLHLVELHFPTPPTPPTRTFAFFFPTARSFFSAQQICDI